MEVLATTAVTQEKQIKGIKIWKGRGKTVPIWRLHDTLYKNPKGSHQKLLELKNEFSKVAGYKVSIQKYAAFIYTNNEMSEKESLKKPFIYFFLIFIYFYFILIGG